jgi:tetratricopeptide (TPR) repeat protein
MFWLLRYSIFTSQIKKKKMKKTLFTVIALALTAIAVKAQTLQDGINHLYADRFKSATDVFQKLLAANPNSEEAIFWQGQVYFDMDDNAKARQFYQKALETSGSQPMILVGLGHSDLMDNKFSDARAKFDAALAASNTKKGANAIVQTAIGRALVDAKGADYNYAVQLLEAAHLANPKNTETILQLGNAYRKQGEGSGGGKAFETYRKALVVDPAFAVADLRMAKMFETQKNWDLVLEYLNSAVKRNPKFAPAYYELFFYHLYRRQYDEAEKNVDAYVTSSDPSWENDYLKAQICYAKKDFACAIAKGEAVVAATGENTKPRVLRSLALAYMENNDPANAKKNIDKYFSKDKDPDKFSYETLLAILLKSGGTPDEILGAYVRGAKVDTVQSDKIEFLKKGITYFRELKMRDKEAMLIKELIPLRKTPIINDYFDLALAHYFTPNYANSRDAALVMIDKFSEQVYGYEWAVNNSKILDTVRKDSIYVPDLLKMEAFAAKDSVKYKKQYLNAARSLANYYFSDLKHREKSIEYLNKWKAVDTANAQTVDSYIKYAESWKPGIQVTPAPKTTTPPTGTKPPATKPKTTATKPVAKPTAIKTTSTNKAVVKK